MKKENLISPKPCYDLTENPILTTERSARKLNSLKYKIVVPGDSPPQIQGSPHLERLKPYGDVVLYTDRPETHEEQRRRAEGDRGQGGTA